MPLRRIMLLVLGSLAWLAAIGVAFGGLQRYAATAGSTGAPGSEDAALFASYRAPGRGLVVMAVHPSCPCTDASLAELGDLIARSQGTCDALILEIHPSSPPADWPAPTPSLELAGRRTPVIVDRDGKLAAAIGAQTSGHVVFIDARGMIRFHGGLTLSRGHRGRAPAQDAILATLGGGRPAIRQGPVFGCALTAECKAEAAP